MKTLRIYQITKQQAENNVYMVVYGDAIIRIIEGGWEESI